MRCVSVDRSTVLTLYRYIYQIAPILLWLAIVDLYIVDPWLYKVQAFKSNWLTYRLCQLSGWNIHLVSAKLYA